MNEKLDKMLKAKNKYRNSENPLDAACFDIVTLNYHVRSLSESLILCKQQLKDANEVLRSYEIITNGKLDEHEKYKDKYKDEE